MVALFIGWIAADDWVLRASGLKDMSDEEIVDSLERVVLQILRENLPAAGGQAPATRVRGPRWGG